MNLQAKYNRDEYLIFLNSFLPKFNKEIRRVEVDGLKASKNVNYLGESPELDLSIFELTHTSSSEARVTLANDGFKIMKNSAAYRALIAYQDDNGIDWRLSLLTAMPDINEKGKIIQKLSNPQRFSFFLGPNAKIHTPEQYLQGRVKDFDELKERFSIEAVNKEFYTSIAILFTKLAGGKRKIGREMIDAGRGFLDLPGTEDDTLDKEFAVRFIGRLVFCWFLKKKRSDQNVPLLPEELLSVQAINENKGYYHGVLEPLFFEVLNTPLKDRDNKYKELPWSQIPFLNGGLFNPHHYDFYEPGALGISKYINTLKIPDHWIKDLFEIFETYNFTIDENTPIDVELSIDPEMLGRIFENLLAEINPETGETARKATGSYYTPRPIVEYMVDESLKQYLLTKTKIKEENLISLLSYEKEDVDLTEAQKEAVIDALDSLKVIDPACGSGAFPMGILQKMLLILQKVDPNSEVWLKKQIAKIDNALLRKEMQKRLEVENVSYIHKLGIIQSAIYGVDIQTIALEISKLRFFLSLIVDELIDDEKENRGVEPLPNLEFKFVCANSLIVLPKKDEKREEQHTLIEADDDIKILKELRDEYLRSYGSQKKKIEKKFLEVQSRMARHALSWALWGGDKSQTMKLSQWDPFSEDPCEWFDPEWMFGVREGFDIAIANPPWVSLMGKHALEENKKNADLYKKIYRENTYMPNLYEYFIQRSINLLKSEGHITFIVPDRFGFNESCSYLRKSILENNKLKEIIYRWKFEGIIADTMTFLIQNIKAPKKYFIKIKNRPHEIAIIVDHEELLKMENFVFKSYRNITIKELVDKIKKSTERLDVFCKTTSGFGGKSGLITEKRINSKQIEIIKGQSIHRYCINKKYYFDFKDANITGRTRDMSKLGYKEKVLLRKTGNRLIAAFDENGIIPEQSLYFTYENGKEMNLKYLLGIINSKLLSWYYVNELVTNIDSTPQLKNYDLDALPIRMVHKKEQEQIINLVDKIIGIKNRLVVRNESEELKILEYERQIDQMVYKLYGLTSEEIEIVEGANK